MYRHFIKPIFDFIAAVSLLLILSPLFIILLILGMINFNGKAFFAQNRVGYKERIFSVVKFKSMRDEKKGEKISEENRLTGYGKFLRKTSLDELPQLFNVLTGKMSMIGPRPLLINYLPWYTVAERKRHLVKPGITGLAQVNGRNNLNWDERLKFDRQYVDEISFLLDLKIAFKTIANIFTGTGVKISPRSEMHDLDTERKLKRNYQLNNNLLLRKPELGDAEQILLLKNNPESAGLLIKQKSNYVIGDIHNWIDHHNFHSTNDLFLIVDMKENKILGHTALYKIDPLSKSCEFGILIGLPEYWGKGIGKAVTAEMIDIAFHELMLQFIFLEVLKSNSRAVKLYGSLRFEVIDEYELNDDSGRIDNILTMQLEHDD